MAPQTRGAAKGKAPTKGGTKGKSPAKGGTKGKSPARGGRGAKGKSPAKGASTAKGKASTAKKKASTAKGKLLQAPDKSTIDYLGIILQAPEERTYLFLTSFTNQVERNYKYKPKDVDSIDWDVYPDRDCVMLLLQKRKMEAKLECQKEFKDLVSYLKKMGFSAAEDPYGQAFQAVIKRTISDAKKQKQISDRIGQYIACRLWSTRQPFGISLSVEEWDDEVLNFIIVSIEELKDLLVRFPELEELLKLTKDTLKANAKWKPTMAGLLKDYLRSWLLNSMDEEETMKKCAKCPAEIVETSCVYEYPC